MCSVIKIVNKVKLLTINYIKFSYNFRPSAIHKELSSANVWNCTDPLCVQQSLLDLCRKLAIEDGDIGV